MFESFAKYINDDTVEKIESIDALLDNLSKKIIKNGMYRVFLLESVIKWNEIVADAFPLYRGKIQVFAYDWLGRVFAINKLTETVLLFEPGTGEVLDIPVDIVDFHNVEIAEYNEDSLASKFFELWFTSNYYVLKQNECAGYKVPLFLNGDDNIGNLEIIDMEVYWGTMAPLIP